MKKQLKRLWPVAATQLVRSLLSTEMLCVMSIIMAVASMVLTVLTLKRHAAANTPIKIEQVKGTK